MNNSLQACMNIGLINTTDLCSVDIAKPELASYRAYQHTSAGPSSKANYDNYLSGYVLNGVAKLSVHA